MQTIEPFVPLYMAIVLPDLCQNSVIEKENCDESLRDVSMGWNSNLKVQLFLVVFTHSLLTNGY